MRKSLKAPALVPGSTITVLAPASSAKEARIQRGRMTLQRLDYRTEFPSEHAKPDGYFSAPVDSRVKDFHAALLDPKSRAIFCTRGGYGSTGLLDQMKFPRAPAPKIFCGFSDVTSLHIYFWQKFHWVTFYGPLVAGGFNNGPNATNGFDPDSFMCAMTATQSGWPIRLMGETLLRGNAIGTLLGGCVTLIQTSLGTPWELDTRGAILVLEDVSVKPYQLDRMLTHLKQAGKFKGVRGILLGDFPESEAPEGSTVTVREVCMRVLGPLGIPIVYGAPVGHSSRPMLTLPLGVQAQLHASGEGVLDILEPAVHA